MSELHHKREGRHTKIASSTPTSLGIGAAEARAITNKKLNVNFRIQKSGHTASKDNSGDRLDLHTLRIWQVGYQESRQALKRRNKCLRGS